MTRQPLTVKNVIAAGGRRPVRQSPGYVPAVNVPRSAIPTGQRSFPRPLSKAARPRITTGNNPTLVKDYFQ